MSLVKISDLHCSYGGPDVIKAISFTVNTGDFIAITGPNGGGKSTLVKSLVGIVTPRTGQISKDESLVGQISYMPQKSYIASANFPATVREVVRSGIAVKKGLFQRLTQQENLAIDESMVQLQVEDLAFKPVGTLSGGQQQRVLLARAFASKPKLLILDEPTGALDPHTRECFYATLKELNQFHDTTVLMVTHDTVSLSKYASRVIHIQETIHFDGPMEQFADSGPTHYFRHIDHENCEGCHELIHEHGAEPCDCEDEHV